MKREVLLRIALIGAGRMGQAVARLALDAGHEVVLTNSRGPDTLGDLVKELGPHASAANVIDAVAGADLVVLGTPWGKTRDALSAVSDWRGKIVVDGTNNRAGPEIFDIGGVPSSIVVTGYMPGARVVKAFNHNAIHVWYEALASKSQANALYVAGDDVDAKRIVSSFISDIGGEAIDAGSLEQGATMYGAGGTLHIPPLQMMTPAEARAKLDEARAK